MASVGRYAIFTGEDGSMGLRNGGVYVIELKSYPQHIWRYIVQWVDPTTNKVKGCPYSSESAFHKNWKFVKREDIQYYDPKRVSD